MRASHARSKITKVRFWVVLTEAGSSEKGRTVSMPLQSDSAI